MVEMKSKLDDSLHFAGDEQVSFIVESGKWYNKKTRTLKLFDDKVHILNVRDQKLRNVHKYDEIMGVTKSLRVGTTTFIMHVRDKADEEWSST